MKKRYKYILLLACAQLFSSCGPSVAETLSGSQANTPNHSATAQVEANQAPFAPSSVHPDTKPVRGRDDTSEKSNVLTGQQAVERAQDNLAKRLNIPLVQLRSNNPRVSLAI